MARIQGITIEIDGDTTGLSKALKSVDNETKNVQKELKQIDGLLKFDSSNVELLTQKQKLLGDAVDSTSKRLDVLKQAQSQVEQQFKNGEIGEEAFRKFQREIIATEGKLKAFKQQAENVDIKLNAQTDTTGIEKMKTAMKELGPAAKQAASEIGSALSTAGAAGTAAVTGLVVGMADTNKDLAMLETQIGQVGLALADIGNARTTFDSVGQETDQVTEAMGNLIQAGYQTKDSIDDISSSLAGAIVKYGDTFNVEGLAESITTTTQLGEVTGQLTDLLEKEGINVDTFNAKMQSLATEQERANYISQLLADQGLTNLYNKYAEGNSEIVNASSAQISMTDALSELSVALTPLVTTVSQFVTKIVEWANENQGLATALAIAGGAVTAIAGAFAILSPVVSGVTAIFPVLATAIGAISAPVAIAVGTIAAVGTAAVVVGKEMSESSIQIADWSSKVSESTAQAVGGFLELSDSATVALNELAWSGVTVTQEMATNLIGIYDQMGQQVLTEMQSDHTAQIQSMTEHFAMSQALTETEEAEILAAMQSKNAEKELVHQESQARIAEILNLAKDEKRAITEAEQQEINSIQQTMTDNAIEYLTENEREQKVILENLKNEASKITAEQAAEVVQNSVKQKDEVVKEAQDQYDQVVAEIIKQRDETGTISAEQAEKLIQEAQKQRDETVSTAEDMHEKVVTEAKEQADEHVAKVDWETGEIKSKWEVLKDNVSKTMGNIGSAIEKGWNDALTWTKNKVAEIKRSAENKFNEMKTAIETKMSEVKTKIETKWGEAKTFLKNIDLLQIGKDIIRGLISGITNKFGAVKAKIEELAGMIPEWAKDILDIRSPSRVMRQIGEWTGEGLAIGIEKSGADVEKATENTVDKVIETFEDLPSTINGLSKEIFRDFNSVNQEVDRLRKYGDKYGASLTNVLVTASKLAHFSSNETRVFNDLAQSQLEIAGARMAMLVNDREKEIQRIESESHAKRIQLITAYENEVEKRTGDILKQYSLLEKVELKDVDSKEFSDSLESQIASLELYNESVSKLAGRNLSTELLNEIIGLGPKMASEVAAFADMSEEELNRYVELWDKKNSLARATAEAELTAMRLEMEEQLALIDAETKKKLDDYNSNFLDLYNALNSATSSEMDKLRRDLVQDGANAIKGLQQGMESQKASIVNTASGIANAISSTIQSALDINSPSKLTRGFGVNVGEGLKLGMDDMISKVAETSQKLADAASNAIGSLANSSIKSQTLGNSSTSSSSVDNSRHFAPSIVINTQDSGSNAMDRTLRRLALKFN